MSVTTKGEYCRLIVAYDVRDTAGKKNAQQLIDYYSKYCYSVEVDHFGRRKLHEVLTRRFLIAQSAFDKVGCLRTPSTTKATSSHRKEISSFVASILYQFAIFEIYSIRAGSTFTLCTALVDVGKD
jgi:hypothetical protein